MRPLWLEIPTKDLETSMRFYRQVLGWRFSEGPDGMILIRDRDGPVGHFWPLKGRLPQRPQVSLYFSVASVTPILNRAVKHGGRIIQPRTKLPDDQGSVGEFADPIGIVWGLHAAK